MNNIQALERIEQAHSARIDQLFWIAASLAHSDLEELLQELSTKDWERLFHGDISPGYIEQYRDDRVIVQALVDYRKVGLLAVVDIPQAYDFTYEKKKPVTWSVNEGISRRMYVYSETMEGLVLEIEKVSEEVFKQYVAKDQQPKPKSKK